MNTVFFLLILVSFLFAAFSQINGQPINDLPAMEALSQGILNGAKSSVELAIGLIGAMTLFLGLIKVAEKGGLLNIISRLLKPIMVWLFPSVPSDHPAMGAIIMNISANVMGLGNAATPFGIKAMEFLNDLNPKKGTASDPMILFLAINTSSVTLLPTGVIALRASAGSIDPAGIVPTTLFATFCSTLTAILSVKLFQKRNKTDNPDSASLKWTALAPVFLVMTLIPLAIFYGKVFSPWIIPTLIVGFLAFGFFRGVKIYEAFVEGAKDGFQVAIKIIPYLVAILVAVSMFQTSGALEFIIQPLSKITELIGLPGEALPMALLRPLSGSGAYGLLAATLENPNIGPDSLTGYLVSTFQGSTETTFYVIAVYFGAIQITKIRYALWPCLLADLAGVLGAVFICNLLYT